jgi:hypothetical protein
MEEEKMSKCIYGCGQPAKYFFKTRSGGCCSPHYTQCPTWRQNMSQIMMEKHPHINNLRKSIESGNQKCVICGKVAKYLTSSQKPCCEPKLPECPEYSKMVSKKMKQRYAENPKLIQQQREIGREVHNRRSVVKKKREKMKDLHHGKSKEAKKFQKNYQKGRKKFIRLVRDLSKNGNHWAGTGNGYCIKHFRVYHKRKSACEICGCTNNLHRHIYGVQLHIHFLDKNYNNTDDGNILTCCIPCHRKVEKSFKDMMKMSDQEFKAIGG